MRSTLTVWQATFVARPKPVAGSLAIWTRPSSLTVIAPVGQAESQTYTCGICGFVYNEYGECPRCKLASEQGLLSLSDDGEGQDILDQVRRFLEEPGRDEA